MNVGCVEDRTGQRSVIVCIYDTIENKRLCVSTMNRKYTSLSSQEGDTDSPFFRFIYVVQLASVCVSLALAIYFNAVNPDAFNTYSWVIFGLCILATILKLVIACFVKSFVILFEFILTLASALMAFFTMYSPNNDDIDTPYWLSVAITCALGVDLVVELGWMCMTCCCEDDSKPYKD